MEYNYNENTIIKNVQHMYNESYIEKYKPHTVDDTVYTDDFKHVLTSLISMDHLNILLKGDKSSGKTTLIDCIIRDYYNGSVSLNNSELIWHFNCLNEQGINGFRETLKVFCQTKCSIYGKKKLIILDDLDYLNEQNQQIIRSNIDKYSWNINFIASCKNLNKVIDSLQSRLNILKVPKIINKDLCTILDKVLQNEEISLCSKSKEFLVNISDLSINILLNNVKKLSLVRKNNILYDDVKRICCQICFNYYDEYFSHLRKKEFKDAIHQMLELYGIGYSFIDILENLVSYIKYTRTLTNPIKFELMKHVCKYIDIAHSFNDDSLEISFFTYDICHLL